MKGRKRRFSPDGWEHIYKNTKDGALLFYTLSDYLVYFTIECTVAREMDMHLLEICLMRDHVHELLNPGRPDRMALFEQTVNAWYAKEFNRSCGRTGQLFNHPYGSAPKRGGKAIRTTIAYIANNAPERKICPRAEDYRWNFIAYSQSSHPFSEPLRIRTASPAMKRAIGTVQARHHEGNIMNYTTLERLFKTLTPSEIQQLTDYIVTEWSVLDHDALTGWFGDYDTLLTAIHANTGSEYDLHETFTGYSDTVYARMATILLHTFPIRSIKEIITWTDRQKLEAADLLLHESGATLAQIGKFLHTTLRRER